MKKKAAKSSESPIVGPDLFIKLSSRRRRQLILPRKLREEADKVFYRGDRQDRSHAILVKWADLELQGALARKETALDASFLLQVFGEGLYYHPATEMPGKYHLERNFPVPGVGTADGAIGTFSPVDAPEPADAAFFLLYECKRPDVEYILSTFRGRPEEPTLPGLSAPAPTILQVYDALVEQAKGQKTK